ncbi:hypothetical protein D0Z67_29265 (plasmid) [Streptomyces seoulensis]|uniref:Uncharacterized protein n=1 Tax=Streptomyces seoulensis TaxID=73044 RepID=A0A4P6U5F6_STRSO|nr:hypothetical protein [Streptomyces seoulensis]QBJ94461.1 hypothetical protein D0Z67_29265 [Streptomyces seoulensis]
MTDIANPTDWSDYDFLEFEGFVSKVENEGFTYAAEEYSPKFESPELQAIANDFGKLRAFYLEHEPKIDAWYQQVGPERACDLHNAHVDEERQRREDACLFGIRCTDGQVITCGSEQYRDQLSADLLAREGNGWRVPEALLRRDTPGGQWTDERPARPAA